MKLLITTPILLLPVGIHFRIYTRVIMAEMMVLYMDKKPMVLGGLPQYITTVVFIIYLSLTVASPLRLIVQKLLASLSVAVQQLLHFYYYPSVSTFVYIFWVLSLERWRWIPEIPGVIQLLMVYHGY